MKRKQIQQQIAAFTGDWKTAARKAKVFDENCCVPLSQLKNIDLSFGHCTHPDGTRHETNNTLHFHYTTWDGEKYWFSILD